ncbi:hypothetical protein [Allokutzneria oryzae]|uniref:Uncharacterized protein n=1 Tax=Allokutzneria oryzae TaxID=1378989 RepID=A0ABV6A7N7_9PSEU
MAAISWHAARLIPTQGMDDTQGRERRATSALLAVMFAVRLFGRAVVRPLGAPSGRVETFVDVPLRSREREFVADGLVRATRGSRKWIALVVARTGNNTLRPEHVDAYLEMAREHGFDAVIAISNEIPAVTTVDREGLHRLSWSQLLCTAVTLRGVVDPAPAWILGELIRYLEHPSSGAVTFDDMGESWEPVREAVAAGTLRAADSISTETAMRFDELLRFACLRLGVEATPLLSRKETADPALRTRNLAEQLAADGVLAGAMRVPGTAGVLHVTVDLRAERIACHLDVDAPREGRPTTRVNWLERQLKNVPKTVRVDPLPDPRSFRITQNFVMSTGRDTFVDSVLAAVNQFYEDVARNLKSSTAPLPRTRSDESASSVPAAGAL